MIARFICWIWHHDYRISRQALFVSIRECARCGKEQEFNWRTNGWDDRE